MPCIRKTATMRPRDPKRLSMIVVFSPIRPRSIFMFSLQKKPVLCSLPLKIERWPIRSLAVTEHVL